MSWKMNHHTKQELKEENNRWGKLASRRKQAREGTQGRNVKESVIILIKIHVMTQHVKFQVPGTTII